jgi:hypothetical protein
MRKLATYSWLHIRWAKPTLWPPTLDTYTALMPVDDRIVSLHAWKVRIRLIYVGTDGRGLIQRGTSTKSEYTDRRTEITFETVLPSYAQVVHSQLEDRCEIVTVRCSIHTYVLNTYLRACRYVLSTRLSFGTRGSEVQILSPQRFDSIKAKSLKR